MRKLTTSLLVLCLCGTACAQQWTAQPPKSLTVAQQQAIVQQLATHMREQYVFKAVGEATARALLDNQKAGKYADKTDALAFAQALTQTLREVAKDKHLAVIGAAPAAAGRPGAQPQPASNPADLVFGFNNGFVRCELLPGKVGVLQIDGFKDPSEDDAQATAEAAMQFLGGADALIVDLRQNIGGDPNMIRLIISYLVGEQPVHINSFISRQDRDTTHFYTHAKVKGKRMSSVPVYVLTSGFTFSAGEEFAYDIQALKRGKIVGEVTGGGANPGQGLTLSEGFTAFVPFGRAWNPITKTNWEGVGVKPDMATNADKALDVAYLDALAELQAKTDGPVAKMLLNETLLEQKAKRSTVTISAETLASYAGQYGIRKITLEEGKLYFQREGGPKRQLLALAQNEFFLPQGPRVSFVSEGGKIIAFDFLHPDGGTERIARTGN